MDRSLVLFLSVLFSTFLALHAVEEDNVPKKPSFVAPNFPPNPFLALYFTSPNDLENILVVSKAKKDGADESIAKYDGLWAIESPQSSAIIGDYSLVLKSEAKHHAVATKLLRPIKFDTPQLVFQYEVRFDKELDCGGAYLKLLSASSDLNLNTFNDKTPYTIMFGPDKCGLEEKLHFIIRYKHKKTGIVEEKHAKKTKAELSNYFKDKKTHLYTLVLRDDNSFEILVDQVKIQSGSLLEDMEPSITPPKEIDDPTDSKPEDWDERSTIVDETAKKPDDWDESEPMHIPDESATKPDGWLDDEPEFIPDPSATAPSDWDTEMDGEWTAPTIKNPKCENAPGCGEWTKPEMLNPKYKGKWSPPTIPNPAYKGIWEPAKIPNPDYFEDHEPYKSLTEVAAVGLELWSMTKDIVFDNFLIVDSLEAANKFADETWTVKRHAERIADPNARSVVDGVSQTIKEKPWLLVLVALVAVFPIAIYFICRSPRPTASHKKTDEPTPDDEPTDKAETPATVPEGDEDDNSTEDDIVRVSNDGSGDSDSAKLASKAELESASEDDVAQPEPKKTGAQKRRARKE